jgi:hypothetical protein
MRYFERFARAHDADLAGIVDHPNFRRADFLIYANTV